MNQTHPGLSLVFQVSEQCRFIQKVRLETLTTHFRQFRIGSFFEQTITPFIVYFDF